MEALPAVQDDNPSSVKSDDSSPQRPNSRTGSPPPNCAICLGTCKNKSFTDSCLHSFCFSCLLTWSKVKAECPLCKQTFRSIIHNVRSNHQYEEYLVVQRQNESIESIPEFSRIDIDRVTAATHRFRYRTTLTIPRNETLAIQHLITHYPTTLTVGNPFPPPSRACPARRRRSPASFRRTVYRHNLWARPLPDFTGRFRTCTPEFYRYNDTQMHRLVPWLNRELHYLLNENVGHISFVMTRIVELLPLHHINSSEFREMLHRYFGDRTEHFLHELYCFASTPYDMTGYDRNVQYTTDIRISTMVNEVISSSDSEVSVDSDIVMVSSSEPAEPPPGPSRFPMPAYPRSYISQHTSNSVIPIETISQSDTDDDSSEVMVVGYIKPPQERTPEIVDLLGSDSDVILQDNPQPEPSQPNPTVIREHRPTSTVKLTLKRLRAHDSGADMRSESDSDDSSYRPPATRRRRSRRHSAPTSDTSRSTPPRSESDSSADPPSVSTGPTDWDYDPDESTYVLMRKAQKKSSKETVTSSKDRRRNRKRSSHSRHKEKKNVQSSEKDKRSKRKSHSGKGVKSSNKTSNNEYSVPTEHALPALDQPSTSGTSKRDREKRKSMKEWKRQRRDSRENRRLRSVVNVMYNSHKNTDESNSSANNSNLSNVTATRNRSDVESTLAASDSQIGNEESPTAHSNLCATRRRFPDTSSDSEDNLPLNLTLQKLNSLSSS